MAFERWDVVTALFPFTDVAQRKPRPVIVLSGTAFNRDHGHVIGGMVTTAARGRWPSDHPIKDLAVAGLTHASVLRWKVFTLPLTVIARRIGTLGPADRDELTDRLHAVLEL